MGNPNNDGSIGFQSLLYVNFIIKKKYRVDETAKGMQIATDTLYRYIRGENIIPPDRIIDLIKVTGDTEYLEFFCLPVDYIPVPAAQAALSDEQREKKELDLAVHLGNAIDAIEKAYGDGRVDKQEYKEIHQHLTKIRQRAAELDREISQEVR